MSVSERNESVAVRKVDFKQKYANTGWINSTTDMAVRLVLLIHTFVIKLYHVVSLEVNFLESFSVGRCLSLFIFF